MSYYKTVTKLLTSTAKESLYVNDASVSALVYGLVFNCIAGTDYQPNITISYKTGTNEIVLMTSKIGAFNNGNLSSSNQSTPYTLTFPKPIALTNQGDQLLVQTDYSNLVSCLCSVYIDTSLDTTIKAVGVWSSSRAYNLNNLVYYSGSTYIATVNTTTVGSNPYSTSSEWIPFSIQTEYVIQNGDGISAFKTGYTTPTATISVAPTLTNKTLVAPAFTDFKRASSDTTNISVPTLGASDTLCLLNQTQTLAYKTLNSPTVNNQVINGYKEAITDYSITDTANSSAGSALNISSVFSSKSIVNINIAATANLSNTTYITLGAASSDNAGRSVTVIITATNISTGTTTQIKFTPTSYISFSNSYTTDPTWTISKSGQPSIFVFMSNGTKWYANVAGEGFQ